MTYCSYKQGIKIFAATQLLIAACLPAYANDTQEEGVFAGEWSANAGLVSEYSFRGITQSDKNPALQGGFDYETALHSNLSFYAGVWGSNVDFNDNSEASLELDGYGGVTFGAGPVDMNLGLIYYAYPGADSSLDYDFVEFQVKAGHDFDVLAIETAVNYSPDYFGGSGSATYVQANSSIPLPHDFSVDLHIGHQSIDDNSAFGLPDYADWSAGIGYAINGFNLSLSYVDTDIGKNNCASGCDSRFILAVSRSF